MPSDSEDAGVSTAERERRSDDRRSEDRRQRHAAALVIGNFKTRRRAVRRADAHRLSSIDWHHPQWLAVTIIVLLLSVADALLTLKLLGLGAVELNPVMALFVTGSGHAFAIWKLGLTGGSVIILVLLARLRVFGGIRVAFLLHGLLLIYGSLVCYELWLLQGVPFLDP